MIYLRTPARRREPHIYAANGCCMALMVVVPVLHIINNLAVSVSFGNANNAVAFCLTSGFLGMLYYHLPKMPSLGSS